MLFDGVHLPRPGDAAPLEDLSFAVAAGSVHMIAGPPGAGKTAIVELILGALRPARGRIELFARDAAHLRRRDWPLVRRRIGTIFQDLRLLDRLSAFDNVAMIPRIAGRRPGDYRDEVLEVLAWVGLGRSPAAPAGALNLRDRRRLALARAVIGRPDLVIADEPTGGLDQPASLSLLRRLADLNRAGTTLIVATADEEMAEGLGAPVLWLDGGRERRGGAVPRAGAA
ncbi:MAG: ATP-binding cassette domain-containing protein [Caulobacteraceae bacterium]